MISRVTMGFCLGVLTLVGSVAIPASASPQNPPTTTQDPGAPAGGGTQDNPQNGPAGQPPIPAATAGGIVRALGTANPLGDNGGPLSWGPLSIRSAEFQEFYGVTNTENNAVGVPPSDTQFVSLLSATIAFNHQVSRSQVAMQYAPSMFITNGSADFSANQQAGIDTIFQLTPRWALGVSDHFSYYASQRPFAGFAIDTDYVTGGVVHNNFLQGPGSVLVNGFDAALNYLLTPRTTLSFGPSFGYQRSTGSLSGSGQTVSGLYEGGKTTITHYLSATSTIGASYFAQYVTFNNTTQAAGPQGGELLQDVLVTYARAFAKDWRLNLGAGLATNSGNAGGNGLAAEAGIGRLFRRGDVTISYNQGHQFNGFVTGQVTERIDGVQHFYWTPRLSTSTSVSYFTTTGAPPKTSGFFVAEHFSYLLAPHVSVFGQGAYIRQSGDNIYILSAQRYLGSFGIRWDSAAPASR
jgi:hypothetical protein